MKKILLFICFISLFGSVFSYEAVVKKVIDGDTFMVTSGNKLIKVRVLGIDAPETHFYSIKSYKFYGCGYKTENFAKKFLLNKKVLVESDKLAHNTGKYGRYLRYIKFKYKGKYVDYGAVVIYKGLAKVYKWEKFSLKNKYYYLQKIAQKYHKGIWSNKCILQDQQIKSENQQTCGYLYHKSGCDIKGNINRKGVKIFHLPGWRFYNITKINPLKGERWFCSIQQAISCGWRASYIR